MKQQEIERARLEAEDARKTRELEDTPAVRGMVNSIPHMVEIIEERD